MSRGKIPQEIIDEIRDRIPIERVVGEYVPLKRAGRNFKGFCPFHKEKTPSFTVNTSLQIFKCFGCGESGNIFTFLMKIEGASFMEILERLASKAGVALPDVQRESPEKSGEREKLLEIMKRAWKIYHEFLLKDPAAKTVLNYLDRRGFDRNSVKKIGFGYAPDAWDFIVKRLNMPAPMLINAGLVVEKSAAQRVYDRFRNRLMIPIRDHRNGHIVAFGGRTMGDADAKYINSPESPIYNKSRILYGLYGAQKAVRQTRDVIIVEGYFDQLALEMNGIHNAVAPCGTSLTLPQVNLLKRNAQTAYILFDADTAGVIAARRALELCLGAGLDTRAVPLPDGQDPDDLIRSGGVDGLRNLMNHALPALDFLIQSASKRHDITLARGRRAVVEEMLPFLIEVDNAIDRGTYISRIADLITVPADSVLELLRRHRRRIVKRQTVSSRENSSAAETASRATLDPRERDLFCFFIQHPEYMAWEDNPLSSDQMVTPPGKRVYQILEDDLTRHDQWSVARMLDQIEQPVLRNIIVDLFDDPAMEQRLINDDPAWVFQCLVACFREKALNRELMTIKQKLRAPDVTDRETEELLKRQLEILDQLHNMIS